MHNYSTGHHLYSVGFYDIQWKRIRGIPFILKSHNNTYTTNQNAYFEPSTG